MDEIRGYKAFNKNHTNRYGRVFLENEDYKIEGMLEFGNYGNGFHMCQNLCDVFRYFDSENICVASVVGSGNRLLYEDEYNGYYDMYVVEKLHINRFMMREEIISEMLEANDFCVSKFLRTFTLNEQEILMFLRKFRNNYSIVRIILYYQCGIKEAFIKKDVIDDIYRLRMVYEYGQNNSQGS